MDGHRDLVGISSTADGLFMSCFVDSIILGITMVQTWSYFRRNKDGWVMQSFVAAIVVFDIAESTTTILALRDYLILKFGDYEYLGTFDPLVPAGLVSTYMIFFLTHAFFVKTVYLVCRRKWLLVLNITLCILMLFTGLASSISIWYPYWLKTRDERNMAGLASHLLASTLDIIVALTLSMSLSEFGWSDNKFMTGSTKELLHRVLIFTVSRGIVMTVAQVSHVALYLTYPDDTMFWPSTHFLISKLYALTTLVSLNARRSTLKNTEVIDDELPSMRFASRDSIDEEDEIEKASIRAIRTAPAFV